MTIRPYLTFNGQCAQAIQLYKEAFSTDTIEMQRFSDMPPIPGFVIPPEFESRILQATLKIGDTFIRMSDCGPGHDLNEAYTERVSIAIEAGVEEIKQAFATLSKEGTVGIPLEATFYSPCAGVVRDKFGVMWNLVGQE